jgi:hypothetical protein
MNRRMSEFLHRNLSSRTFFRISRNRKPLLTTVIGQMCFDIFQSALQFFSCHKYRCSVDNVRVLYVANLGFRPASEYVHPLSNAQTLYLIIFHHLLSNSSVFKHPIILNCKHATTSLLFKYSTRTAQ